MTQLVNGLFPLATDEELDRVLNKLDANSLDGWSYYLEVAGFTVHRRPLGETGLYSYQCRGFLEGVTPELMEAMQRDLMFFKEWDKYCLEIRRLGGHENAVHCYWSVKFPWPLSNRDYTFIRYYKKREDGTMCIVSRAAPHPECPPNAGFVRVDTYNMEMTFRRAPGDDPRLEILFLYEDDIKGSIPKLLINWAAKIAVPQYIKDLQASLRRFAERQQQAPQRN
eukprot:gnl/Trimastix_PCT/2846.p1 GENE.gnl/Trimastix_PCT/2846~~gnl/Trimastix_PCT/2846.p1  ORF type:complete len:224 (+),score=57.99 gnl/Trimastix_PCT/2846:84-755(+)